MTEIELKFPFEINSLGSLESKLKVAGFSLSKPRVYEKNTMYDNPAGLMEKTDGRIRIRQSGDDIEFAYKKPITREGIKQEIEYEVLSSDLQNLEKILEMMEFTETTSYERYRTEFKKGETKITVDEYPFGSFLEIEDHNIDSLKKLSLSLGFDLENNLTDSCDTLFAKWRKEKGLPPKSHMKFDDYER